MSSSPEEIVQASFIKRGWSLTTAESCTAGRVASRITRLSESSNYFLGSIVAYSIESKKKILKVSPQTISAFGVVSEEVALEMARGAISLFESTFSIGVTGIAGPLGGTQKTPIGTICFAITGKKEITWTTRFEGTREKILELAAAQCLTKLSEMIN